MGIDRARRNLSGRTGALGRFTATLRHRERGQILVLTAMLLTALLAFAGLLVDAGYLYAQRRQAQNAADQAAVAATRVLLEGGSTSSAIAAALEYAEANGFDTDDSSNSVTVNIPPSSGEHAGDHTYVEVIIGEEPGTFFIHVLVADGATVQARGVAGVNFHPEPYAVIVLDEDDCEAYDQIGGADLTISGGSIMVNSNCQPDALSDGGSGDLLVDGTIDVYGGYQIGGSGAVSPQPRSVPWTVDDPLENVVPPTPGAPAPGSTGTALVPDTWRVTSGGGLTLYPGTYYGGFYSNCTCTINMEPGVYIMAGGGFTKAGGTGFVGDGVMIYVTENPTNPTGDGAPEPLSLTGSGVLDLSPPTSGPYENITLWQDAAITDDFRMRGSNDLAEGIFYVPGAELDFAGNTEGVSVQLIVKEFYIHGNSVFDIVYQNYWDIQVPDAVLVE